MMAVAVMMANLRPNRWPFCRHGERRFSQWILVVVVVVVVVMVVVVGADNSTPNCKLNGLP